MSNLLNIGIDLPKLEADKQAAIVIVRELFEELSKFDNTKISPINISGLSELTASIRATNEAVSTLKTSVSEFGLAMQQYNKTADDVAKTQAKISVSASDEAQQLAKLKVQLAELNRQNLENAKADNQIIQDRLNRQSQQKALAEKEKQDLASIAAIRKQNNDAIKKEEAEQKALADKKAAEDKKRAQEAIALKRQQQQQFKQIDKEAEQIVNQQIALDKKQEAEQKAKIKADQAEARQILELSDDYQLLLTRKKELEGQYAQVFAAGLGKTEAGKGILNDLGEVNGVISTIDKNLEKAGSGGATALARALTSGLSSLRTIAYILPGIGIAGIFNLAYTAIEDFVSGLGDAKAGSENLLKAQLAFNQAIQDQINLLVELDKQQNEVDTTRRLGLELSKRQQDIDSSQGQNRETQLTNQVNLLNRQFIIADTQIKSQFGDFQNLQKAIQSNINTLDGYAKKISDLDKLQQSISSGTFKNRRDGENTVQFTLRLKNAPTEEEIKNRKDLLTSEYNLLKEQNDKNLTLLNDYINAESDLNTKAYEKKKYLDDEERKRVLENAEQEVAIEKNKNSIILNDQLSTEQARKNAVSSNLEQDRKLLAAQRDDVLNNISSSQVDRINAVLDYYSKVQQATKDSEKQIEGIEKEFYQRRAQFTINSLRDEVLQDQVYNEEIFKSESKTYADRITALQKYHEDRKTEIQNNFVFEKDKAEREIPSDLLPFAIESLTKSRDKQLFESTQNTQQEIYSIVESWYKKQFDLIVGAKDKQILETVRQETAEIGILNDSYEKKKIGFEKYQKDRQKIEQKYSTKGIQEKLDNDTDYLQKLLTLSSELGSKIDFTREEFINADTPEKAKNKGDELDAFLAKKKEVDVQIVDQQKQVDADQLALELSKNKKIEENRKTFYANLVRLERELFRLTKQIVDESYQYRIDKIEAQNKAYDEQVGREKDAIERSTLNQKDKNAYEIQLEAQKTAADKKAADEEKKLKHDQAVFDKKINIAEIITSTSLGVAKTLADGGGFAIPLAISVGALGAVALATALAASIPSYAKGGKHQKEGFALFAEAGYAEVVKEPNKPAWVATRPTIGWLPSGTELMPMYDTPTVSEHKYKDNSWEQTMFLAKTISRSTKRTNNTIKANINISFKDIDYKNRIIHG